MTGQTLSFTNDETYKLGEVDAKNQEEDDLRFYSVTTIIGALDKPALLYWAAEEAAKCAVANRSVLAGRVKTEGEEAVIKWIRDSRFRPLKGARSATDLGTAVHEAVFDYVMTGVKPEVDDEVRPFLEQFDKWAQKWQPVYLAAEAAVYNLRYGVAGTLDNIMQVDGMTLISDTKTSRKSIGSDDKPTKPYPEAAMQLAAYRHMEIMATWRARRFEKFRRRYYLLNALEKEEAIPMPKVDGAVVLHITPEHCDLYPVKADEEVFESFIYTIQSLSLAERDQPSPSLENRW